jgi:hypothetical protein
MGRKNGTKKSCKMGILSEGTERKNDAEGKEVVCK